MSTVFAHAAAAAAAYNVTARRFESSLPGGYRGMALGAAIGALPDIDVPLAIAARALGWGDYAHRGWTHSLFFCLAVSVMLGLWFGRFAAWRKRLALVGAFFLVTALHPVLDWAMGCGPKVPFLWPFTSEGWLSFVQLVPTAFYAQSIGGLVSLLWHDETLRGLAFEVGIFGPPLYLSTRRRCPSWLTALLVAVCVAAVALTAWCYNPPYVWRRLFT